MTNGIIVPQLWPGASLPRLPARIIKSYRALNYNGRQRPEEGPNGMSEESVFMEGGNEHFLIEMEMRDANILTVEPYAIYSSPKKRRFVLVYQVSRAGAQGDNGWRYIEASNIRTVKKLNRPFTTRKDYDPFNKDILVMSHYSIA